LGRSLARSAQRACQLERLAAERSLADVGASALDSHAGAQSPEPAGPRTTWTNTARDRVHGRGRPGSVDGGTRAPRAGPVHEDLATAAAARGEITIWPRIRQLCPLSFIYPSALAETPIISALLEALCAIWQLETSTPPPDAQAPVPGCGHASAVSAARWSRPAPRRRRVSPSGAPSVVAVRAVALLAVSPSLAPSPSKRVTRHIRARYR
jgi:hypothetical protein